MDVSPSNSFPTGRPTSFVCTREQHHKFYNSSSVFTKIIIKMNGSQIRFRRAPVRGDLSENPCESLEHDTSPMKEDGKFLDARRPPFQSDSPVPRLVRSDSLESEEQSEYGDQREQEREAEGGHYKVTTSLQVFHLSHICHICRSHVMGIVKDFSNSGLPWETKEECQSAMAGLSGVLFVLPGLLVLHDLPSCIEQRIWIITACLSVWADYSNAHRRSIAHGIDRCWATSMVLSTAWRGGKFLAWWTPALVLPCLACYIFASHAKQRLDLRMWHYWHFGWHLASVTISCLGVYLTYHCDKEAGGAFLLETFSFMCQ